jgi:plastocyanin
VKAIWKRGRLFRSFIPALVIALFVVGIGTAAAKQNAATVNVEIGDNFFKEANVTVNVGDTVTWTNKGQRPHDVTADNQSFKSPPRMMNGATFSFTFTTPGTYTYICTIHAGQNGTITVQGAPGAAPRTGGGGMAETVMVQWQQLGALAIVLIGGSAALTFLRLRRRA